MPRTTKALKKNVEALTSTKKSRKQSTTSSKKRTQTTKGKTTTTRTTGKGTTSSRKTSTTRKVKGGTSSKITIIQSRKKDMFPMMNMYKYPYHFEPMPEIADRLNKAWFDEHYGEERMKEHIRKHKLKSHQYKAYVNYWWLQDKKKRGLS